MAGRVYTHRVRVDGSDVGPQGRAHLDSIADWLQAVAFADGLDAGLGTAGAWILRRTSLRIVRLPRFGEDLSLRTWCGGLAASVAERRTSIEGDGGSAIEAEAVWVHIDPASRRPARFPPQFLALYAESAGGRRPRTKLRHPAAPPADAAHASWSFTAADVDVAGHVNNAVYWRVAEEILPRAADPEDGTLLEAEYRSGLGAGPADVAIADDGMRAWVLASDGSVAATLSVATD